MELGGKLLNSLRIKTQFLARLQSVSVVDVSGATHTQKDDVESNGGSLENVAKVFVLFLCGVQLVLRSGVFTIHDLDEMDVTPRFAEVFRSYSTTRHHTPFKRDTDRNDSNLPLTFQSQCTTAAEI
jgi:hypothetical protein